MDGHVKLWSSIGHICLLGLTLLLLLFEIIVSRLCRCLINMVDGFHTLYILLHLSLQRPWATHTPPDSSSPVSPNRPPLPLASSPHISSLDSHITSSSHTDSSPPSTPHPDLNSMSPCGPLPNFSRDITSPPLCFMPSRIQPFGALFSALVVASLCVSVTLEILNHILQPHPIQRPILATVASALSLFFNAIILLRPILARLGLRPAKSASVSISAAEPLGLQSNERVGAKTTEDGLVGGVLQDGSLLFCNPAASSVLDADSESVTPTPDSLGSSIQHETSPSAEQDTEDHPQANSRALELTDIPSQVPVCCTGHTGNPADLCVPSLSLPYKASTRGHQSCDLHQVPTTILYDLLCPCLALANALTALLGSPDCHHPQEACSSLVYLDPAVSLAAVMALLACTLPEVRRLGLLLLQSCPPGLSVPELRRELAAVPGVEDVHELHAWQLTETYMVASVHVHVDSHCWRDRPDEVIARVTETLRKAGVSMCTVQPECLNGESALAASPDKLVEDRLCSLPCRKECLDKMCCTPQTKAGIDDGTPPSGDVEEKPPQAVIIENTFL